MGEILASPSEIKAKAEQLKTLNGQFKSEVEKMVGYQQSLNNMWEGEAKDKFNEAFNTDKGKWETFMKVIEQFVTAMLDISSTLEQAERTNIQIASQRA